MGQLADVKSIRDILRKHSIRDILRKHIPQPEVNVPMSFTMFWRTWKCPEHLKDAPREARRQAAIEEWRKAKRV